MCKQSMYSILIVTVLALTGMTQADIETGLVGWWALDDGEGQMARDSAPHPSGPHHGTLEGPTWETADAAIGTGSALFEGEGDRIIVEPFDVTGTGITVALWHKPFVFTNGRLISKDGPDGTAYWYIRTNDEGRNYGYVRTTGGARGRWFPGRVAMQLDEWNHIAVTWDQDQTCIGQFIDGVLARCNGFGSSEDKMALGPNAQVAIGNWSLDTNMFVHGLIDDVRVYERALTNADMMELFQWNGLAPDPSKAGKPTPINNALDVPSQGIVLAWAPGDGADQHDVYFGTDFDDVNEAISADGAYLGRQPETQYTLATQPFGQMSYWRVDEVNDTTGSVVKGDVWQFTVEPLAIAIMDITATASSSDVNQVAANTINGVGLDADDLHSGVDVEMWLSGPADMNAAWIQYEFAEVYKLHEMLVWNHNTALEPALGLGIKEAFIETSVDGNDWSPFGTTHEFTRATGLPGSAPETIVDMGGVAAKYVRITANSNWGGILTQYGLSEVRFMFTPVLPREPNPASGARGVAPDVVLSWRAGRGAVTHNVYLGEDELIDPDDPNSPTKPMSMVGSPTEAIFDAASLGLCLDQDYIWRIDEVNDAETPSTWQGPTWSFSTPAYLTVDDFESYADEEFKEIWATWVDGYNDDTNGSVVGTGSSGAAPETVVIYGGTKSLPVAYDNTTAPTSETTRTFDPAQDWAVGKPEALVIYVTGQFENVGGGQLYAKINGDEVLFDGDPTFLSRPFWTQWNIPLAGVGMVNTLTIGIKGAGAKGVLYVDEVRLAAEAGEVPVALDPGTDNLVAYYSLDNDAQDKSGNGHNGTVEGFGKFVSPGWDSTGAAFEGGGFDDRITIPSFDLTGTGITLMAWIKPYTFTNDPAIIAKVPNDDNWRETRWQLRLAGTGDRQLGFRLSTDRLEGDDPNVLRTTSSVQAGGALVQAGEWTHVAVTWDADDPFMRFYHNVTLLQSTDKPGFAVSVMPEAGVAIGNLPAGAVIDPGSDERPFDGLIDEVRIYDRGLSQGEVLHVASGK